MQFFDFSNSQDFEPKIEKEQSSIDSFFTNSQLAIETLIGENQPVVSKKLLLAGRVDTISIAFPDFSDYHDFDSGTEKAFFSKEACFINLKVSLHILMYEFKTVGLVTIEFE